MTFKLSLPTNVRNDAPARTPMMERAPMRGVGRISQKQSGLLPSVADGLFRTPGKILPPGRSSCARGKERRLVRKAGGGNQTYVTGPRMLFPLVEAKFAATVVFSRVTTPPFVT